jgi:hypothetical protein
VIVSDNSLHKIFPSTTQTKNQPTKIMKNTLHTPGPWAIHTCNENGPSLDSFYLSTTAQTWDGNEEDRIICRFPTGTGQFSDMGRENLANARLIASAPDLLSALESAYNAIAWDIPGGNLSDQEEDALLDVIREALRKAKGEA